MYIPSRTIRCHSTLWKGPALRLNSSSLQASWSSGDSIVTGIFNFGYELQICSYVVIL